MDFDDETPVYVISVAAELAGMHPQTLRMYERRGLVRPSRTARTMQAWRQIGQRATRDVQSKRSGMRDLLARICALVDHHCNTRRCELDRHRPRGSHQIAPPLVNGTDNDRGAVIQQAACVTQLDRCFHDGLHFYCTVNQITKASKVNR